MKLILSENNGLVQRLSKLRDKKYRREERMYLVEGAKMVREAFELRQDVRFIALDNRELNRFAGIHRGPRAARECLSKIVRYRDAAGDSGGDRLSGK